MHEAQWYKMDDGFLSEHLLTVAGAAHVDRHRRFRVSRLTVHQKDALAPERADCKRGRCLVSKYGRSKCPFFGKTS